MTVDALHFPRWTTASAGDAPDTVPMELEHLGSHYSTCTGGRGRWFALRCFGESVHELVAPRIVTTLCIAAAAIALVATLA